MSDISEKIGSINVTSLEDVRTAYAKYDAVITIEDDGCTYGFRATNGMPQLVLGFHDINKVEHNYIAPSIDHIQHAVDFARKHREGKLVIHCHAGISRSPATALAIIADRLGEGREVEAVDYLYAAFKNIEPNERVVQIADRILARDRALTSAFRRKAAEVASSKPKPKSVW